MFRAKEPNNNRKDLNNMICQDTKALFKSQTSQNDLKFIKTFIFLFVYQLLT